LTRLYKERREQGLVVAAITTETAEKAAAFLKENPVPFPVLYDPSGKAGNAYGVQGIPVTCVVDRQGKIAHTLEGFMQEAFWNEFAPHVAKALES
jgi:peroxiredoxin